MSNPYNDPRLRGASIRFDQVGDRAKGTIANVKVYEGQDNTGLEYEFVNVVAKQAGQPVKWDKAGLIAGSKNLLGQLVALQPQVGDELDITLTELRPLARGSAKIFLVQHQPALPGTTSEPSIPASSSDDDLFAG